MLSKEELEQIIKGVADIVGKKEERKVNLREMLELIEEKRKIEEELENNFLESFKKEITNIYKLYGVDYLKNTIDFYDDKESKTVNFKFNGINCIIEYKNSFESLLLSKYEEKDITYTDINSYKSINKIRREALNDTEYSFDFGGKSLEEIIKDRIEKIINTK